MDAFHKALTQISRISMNAYSVSINDKDLSIQFFQLNSLLSKHTHIAILALNTLVLLFLHSFGVIEIRQVDCAVFSLLSIILLISYALTEKPIKLLFLDIVVGLCCILQQNTLSDRLIHQLDNETINLEDYFVSFLGFQLVLSFILSLVCNFSQNIKTVLLIINVTCQVLMMIHHPERFKEITLMICFNAVETFKQFRLIYRNKSIFYKAHAYKTLLKAKTDSNSHFKEHTVIFNHNDEIRLRDSAFESTFSSLLNATDRTSCTECLIETNHSSVFQDVVTGTANRITVIDTTKLKCARTGRTLKSFLILDSLETDQYVSLGKFVSTDETLLKSQFDCFVKVVKTKKQLFFVLKLIETAGLIGLEKARVEENYKELIKSKISHEFKTPLFEIQSLSQKRGEKLDSEIFFAAEILIILFSDLLQYLNGESVEATKQDTNMYPLKLAEYTESLAEKVKTSLNKNIGISQGKDSQLRNYYFSIKEIYLKQIIFNLVSNALKYSDKGEVNIDFRLEECKILRTSQKHYLILKVKDSASPLGEESVKLLKNPMEEDNIFSSNGKSSSLLRKGLGAGLSIVRRMVTRLNISLSVLTEEQGNTIEIKIPLRERENLQEDTVSYGEILQVEEFTESILYSSSRINSVHQVISVKDSIGNEFESARSSFSSAMHAVEVVTSSKRHRNLTPDLIKGQRSSFNHRSISLSKRSLVNEFEKIQFHYKPSARTSTQFKGNNARFTVLLAEDSEIIRNSMREVLVKACEKQLNCEFEVVALEDGVDLLAEVVNDLKLAERRVKLIVSDHQMKFIDGGEVCSVLRQTYKKLGLNPIPFFICSAFDYASFHEKMIDKGVEELIPKPLETSNVVRVLELYFSQYLK